MLAVGSRILQAAKMSAEVLSDANFTCARSHPFVRLGNTATGYKLTNLDADTTQDKTHAHTPPRRWDETIF